MLKKAALKWSNYKTHSLSFTFYQIITIHKVNQLYDLFLLPMFSSRNLPKGGDGFKIKTLKLICGIFFAASKMSFVVVVFVCFCVFTCGYVSHSLALR